MGSLVNFDSVNTFLQANSKTGNGGISVQEPTVSFPKDTAVFGSSAISTVDTINIVVGKALDKLLEVVDNARAELGIEEGAEIDTSAEATANRIVDFALGAFEHFRDNHAEFSETEARQEFAQFIGGAIGQGIEEARDIIEALNSLDPEVESLIANIADIITQQLEAFANGGSDD